MMSITGMPSRYSSGQHAGGRVRRVDARIALERIAVGVPSQHRGVPRLDPIVELLFGPARELPHERARARVAEERRQVDERRQPAHEREVGANQLANARTLDLDRDRRAVGQLGAMHLADRGRGVRLPVERPEERLHGTPKLVLDDRPDVVGGKRPIWLSSWKNCRQ